MSLQKLQDSHGSSRIYGLDVLRAAAISLVMFSHAQDYLSQFASPANYYWLLPDGVGLFFVLSGFLIGSILIQKIETAEFDTKQLFNFWFHRWFRTFPAYFVVLILLVGSYFYIHQQLPPNWARYFCFTQNLFSPHPIFFYEAWSLPVEEWFYLLVPLVLFLLLKLKGLKRNKILLCIVAVISIVSFIRFYKTAQHDYFSEGVYGEEIFKVVITRMDTIMYGMLGAWLSFYFPSRFYAYKKVLLIFGLLLLTVARLLLSTHFYLTCKPFLDPFAALCLLPALNSLKNGEGAVYKGITFISRISYSMYLTNHMIVKRGILPAALKVLPLNTSFSAVHSLVAFALFWAITIVVAFLLYRLVEKPFMDLRKRLWQ